MEFLTSNVFLQTIPLYIPTLHPIYHPIYGSFTVLENSHGSKILKKVITSDQLARMDNDLLERFQKLGSNNILQIKGVIREENGLYSAFYEYFEQTLKEEIEEKALEGVRYTSQQVLNVVQNISSALSGMQNNRFIHGEVKSSNIVRVGKDYKLLCPILFGKTLPIFTTEDPKSYVRNTTKIVSPEMLNAAHRDIIDPVHEDYKDDIYGLGLVALDMMTMRVEAPISVQKRLESSNLTYSNTLLRLIKKMLEDVLTLRLDPVACNQYIEKIYHQVGLESSKPPLNHNRNLSGIALTRKGATEDVPRVHLIGEQGRSHSISQQPSPVVSRTLTRTESCTPERKSLNFSYLLPEEIRRSPSYLVDDTSLHGKEAMKDRYAFPEVQRSDNTILQELELVKNYASGGSSRDEGFHNPQKDSSSCSMLSTNLTYNFAPLKKDGFETKSNIWDLSHMSPSTSETRLEFASMEDSAIVDRMWVAEKEVRSKPPRELMKRIVVPPVQVSREIRSGREKEKTENTPRFKEGSFGGKGSESQVDTSRRVYEDGMKRHEDSIRTMDSQRTQKYIGSPGPKTNEVQLKENVNSNYEMRSSSAPRNSTDTSNQGKRILRLNKKSLTPLVKKDGDTLTIRCYLNSDMETKCSESSMPEEKELLSNQLHREKVEDVPESISIYVHKPVIRQENRTRKQPLQTNTEVRRVVLGELKSQPNNLLERFSNSSFAENISETKESMIQSQVNFEQNTSIYSSNLFPKPSLMAMKSSYSQPNLRDSQLQKSRIVKEKSGDGSTYEGEMVGYLKHGRGKLTYSHGRYYEGEWQDGKISGFGTLYTDKADVIYQGLWQDGKYNGQGFENNLAPTEGHLLWEDQIRVPIKELGAWLKYQGQFADNAWNGFGDILLCNGDRYIGNFEDNKVNGRGRYIAKDGRIWEGEWQSNYLIATI